MFRLVVTRGTPDNDHTHGTDCVDDDHDADGVMKMFRILLAIIFVMMHGNVMLGSHYVIKSGGREDSRIGGKWWVDPRF